MFIEFAFKKKKKGSNRTVNMVLFCFCANVAH